MSRRRPAPAPAAPPTPPADPGPSPAALLSHIERGLAELVAMSALPTAAALIGRDMARAIAALGAHLPPPPPAPQV